MEVLLLGTLLAFVITYAAIPVIIKVAEIKKLYDIPNDRKVHAFPVPSLGGLGIFAGFIIASLLTISISNAQGFQYYFAAAFVIFFVGLKDDILVLTPMKKIIGQVIAAFIIIYKGGVVIKSMHGFLGVQELPEAIGLALTYLTVIVVINSFNLIDGVDGLAAGLGIFTTLCFGVYFYIDTQFQYAALSFAMSGSLLAFLIFNRSPARIFMGDTGSLALGGFVIGTAYMMHMPLYILMVGLIYLVEVVSVILQVGYFKATHGKRLFKMAPIHHHFELCGWSETRVVAVFTIVTVLLSLLALLAL